MAVWAFLSATVFLFALPVAAWASEPRSLDWPSLIDPAAQQYEDPFRALTTDQLMTLRRYARSRTRAEDAMLSDVLRQEANLTAEKAASVLESDGINIDALLAERWVVAERRERAATAVNPELDGQQVSLFGFAIAAPAAEDGSSVVYLVPQSGMCSHMPPPYPNQLVRARLDTEWRPAFLHEPVRLTGTLAIQDTRHKLFVLDGEMTLRASILLEVDKIETGAGVLGSDWPRKGEAVRRAESSKTGGSAPDRQPDQ